jgi:KamA family protein
MRSATFALARAGVPEREPDHRFRGYGADQLNEIAARYGVPASEVEDMRAVAAVLPFRVNQYVLDELIDWSRVPNDPIFRLVFPQRSALSEQDLQRMLGLMRSSAGRREVAQAAHEIRMRLNPHPAGQLELNRPNGFRGLQHKYAQTVLFFPSAGQTCHAYCQYCFRWPQFVGEPDLKFSQRDGEALLRYVQARPEVSDVLVTGGDPLIMRAGVLERMLAPLLQARIDHIRTIRIGTKSLAYWPHRFVNDDDADDLLRLFERIVASGFQLGVMAHYSHPRELEPGVAGAAVGRVLSTGARIWCQAPLIRGVNDAPEIWRRLWIREHELGCVPYYMFVERDTGPRWLFEVPLARAHQIFSHAYRQLPGLARTVRGPTMSATPGKVVVDGIAELAGERVFSLRFLQARRAEWIGRPFFAAFDAKATWLSDLRPAGGERKFFFEREEGP